MQEILNSLKSQSKNLSLLYVEDNTGLRLQMEKFLMKFFSNLYIAKDGEEGIELYKRYQTDIVITDIKMPGIDGLEMANKIKDINPRVKIIVTSAFDDKEILYKAIEAGVFRYTRKPLPAKDLIKTLLECSFDIIKNERAEIFSRYIKDIFNYQDNMLVLMEQDEPIVANQNFLNFFNVENLDELKDKYKDIGDHFEKVESFLYNSSVNWLKQVRSDPMRLFNIKILNKDGRYSHLILKVKQIPENKDQTILSFSDITQLGLLSMFEKPKGAETEKSREFERKNLFSLLKAVKNNGAAIKLLNFYKGLTITNSASIEALSDDRIVFKTAYLQQKAVEVEKSTVMISDFLPKDILCRKIEYVDFENRTVTAQNYIAIERSPRERQFVRIVPEDEHKAAIVYNGRTFDVRVDDISIKAVKIEISALPAGLKTGNKATVSITLFIKDRPLHIDCRSSVLRIDELKDRYHIVLMFDISESDKRKLTEYVANRQITLIREFKSL